MKAAMILAPLAVTAAGFFSTPSHAEVGVVVGVPGIHVQIGTPVYAPPPPVVYEPPPPPVYDPGPVVVVDEPYWVWVPGFGYRYWDQIERDRWERVHYERLYRYGYEPGWREHARYWRERPAYDRDRYVRYERERPRYEHRGYENRGYVDHRGYENHGGGGEHRGWDHRGGGGGAHGEARGRPAGHVNHR